MICVTAAERTVAELQRRLQAAKPDALHEVRLDLLDPWDDAVFPLLRSPRVVATCRHAREGGRFDGSSAEHHAVLARALDQRPGYLDVEASVPSEVRRQLFDRRRTTRLISSWHHFGAGPWEVPQGFPDPHADMLKVAIAVDDVAEVGAVLNVLREERRPVIRLAMGEAGQVSRALYTRCLSPWTYVVPDGAAPVAPGQLNLSTAARWRVTEALIPLGLLGGARVRRSPGPDVYNRLFARHGLPFIYLPVVTARPLEALAVVERLGFAGVSVTMPAKEALAGVVDELLPPANSLRAINTIVLRNGRRVGSNTDVIAVARLLAGQRGRRAMVLGGGGAARAAAAALVGLGCAVVVTARRPEGAAGVAEAVGASALPWARRADEPFDVLVNATPCGEDGWSSPMPGAVDWRGRVVLDAVISDATPLTTAVEQGGGRAIGGNRWWLEQGVAQMEALVGRRFTIDELEEAKRG